MFAMKVSKKIETREKRFLYREKSFLYVVGLNTIYDQFWVQFYKINLLTIASGHVCCESIEKIRN